MKLVFALAVAVGLPTLAMAQDIPAPYGKVENQWASPENGQSSDVKWGSTAGIERGPKGEIWAIDRCGANTCDGSGKGAVVLLDMKTGKAIRSIGAGLFVFPHGLHVDGAGNVWVTDGSVSKDGAKGLQVIKLSPQGEVLLRLGIAGKRGNDGAHFQSPSDVITTTNGDIFGSDGHAPITGIVPPDLEMRVMKFSKDGTFIKQWGGKAGKGRDQFNNPHALGLDARGRLFVADRANNRTLIFDQDGKFIADWRQFGRPSGFYITGDRLYAIDADSSEANHPGGWRKGVWIGSIREGRAEAFVPDDTAGEGVVIAPDGNMYGAVNVAPRGITRYQKK